MPPQQNDNFRPKKATQPPEKQTLPNLADQQQAGTRLSNQVFSIPPADVPIIENGAKQVHDKTTLIQSDFDQTKNQNDLAKLNDLLQQVKTNVTAQQRATLTGYAAGLESTLPPGTRSDSTTFKSWQKTDAGVLWNDIQIILGNEIKAYIEFDSAVLQAQRQGGAGDSKEASKESRQQGRQEAGQDNANQGTGPTTATDAQLQKLKQELDQKKDDPLAQIKILNDSSGRLSVSDLDALFSLVVRRQDQLVNSADFTHLPLAQKQAQMDLTFKVHEQYALWLDKARTEKPSYQDYAYFEFAKARLLYRREANSQSKASGEDGQLFQRLSQIPKPTPEKVIQNNDSVEQIIDFGQSLVQSKNFQEGELYLTAAQKLADSQFKAGANFSGALKVLNNPIENADKIVETYAQVYDQTTNILNPVKTRLALAQCLANQQPETGRPDLKLDERIRKLFKAANEKANGPDAQKLQGFVAPLQQLSSSLSQDHSLRGPLDALRETIQMGLYAPITSERAYNQARDAAQMSLIGSEMKWGTAAALVLMVSLKKWAKAAEEASILAKGWRFAAPFAAAAAVGPVVDKIETNQMHASDAFWSVMPYASMEVGNRTADLVANQWFFRYGTEEKVLQRLALEVSGNAKTLTAGQLKEMTEAALTEKQLSKLKTLADDVKLVKNGVIQPEARGVLGQLDNAQRVQLLQMVVKEKSAENMLPVFSDMVNRGLPSNNMKVFELQQYYAELGMDTSCFDSVPSDRPIIIDGKFNAELGSPEHFGLTYRKNTLKTLAEKTALFKESPEILQLSKPERKPVTMADFRKQVKAKVNGAEQHLNQIPDQVVTDNTGTHPVKVGEDGARYKLVEGKEVPLDEHDTVQDQVLVDKNGKARDDVFDFTGTKKSIKKILNAAIDGNGWQTLLSKWMPNQADHMGLLPPREAFCANYYKSINPLTVRPDEIAKLFKAQSAGASMWYGLGAQFAYSTALGVGHPGYDEQGNQRTRSNAVLHNNIESLTNLGSGPIGLYWTYPVGRFTSPGIIRTLFEPTQLIETKDTDKFLSPIHWPSIGFHFLNNLHYGDQGSNEDPASTKTVEPEER